MNIQRTLFVVVIFEFFFLACSDNVSTQTALPAEKSELFSGSGNCVLCHQSNGVANTTDNGLDVSQPTQWRSTMMANAAKDPFWQALVRSEAAEIPELSDIIQDRCTNCHLPMGHELAHENGDEHYILDEGKADPLAMDGVSCTLCHQIEEENFGTVESFSGNYDISETRVTYGPYSSPTVQPMLNITGFTPVYSKHVEKSELCATCHTLFTPYVDNENNIVGEFPEQTPYIEWKHSSYPSEDKQCQSCHMPVAEGDAFPISTLGMTVDRSPFYKHHFVGGNTMVLKMLKAHGGELGVTADEAHFDSTYALVLQQLQNNTAKLTASHVVQVDKILLSVMLENLAGHKFPSGFPSRRVWLHVKASDATDQTIFESGAPDSEGKLALASEYEPHHTTISDDNNVQIYEAVMEDVDGAVTFQLLRAGKYKKDNRIPPRGFDEDAMSNDTIGVTGAALQDTDFNRSTGLTGTGSDITHYEIALGNSSGPYKIEIKVLYQSIKPAFLDHMFKHDIAEINRFKGYYNEADKTPTLIQKLVLSTQPNSVKGIPLARDISIGRNYPNPCSISKHGYSTISYSLTNAMQNVCLEMMNIYGTVVHVINAGDQFAGLHEMRVSAEHMSPGMYFYRLRGAGTSEVQKMVITP